VEAGLCLQMQVEVHDRIFVPGTGVVVAVVAQAL